MPSRNFNDRRNAQERVTFTIGPDDHEFKCKMRVRPEVIVDYEQLEDDAPSSEVLAVIDRMVTDLLLPEEHAAWRALRERDDDDAVELGELAELAAWLVESVVNRPLEAPSSSSDGPSTTGTPSTVASPSPAAVASAG